MEDACFGGVVGCNWAKMLANLANTVLVSVPKVANGAAGAELGMRWTRSSDVTLVMSIDDVAGIFIW